MKTRTQARDSDTPDPKAAEEEPAEEEAAEEEAAEEEPAEEEPTEPEPTEDEPIADEAEATEPKGDEPAESDEASSSGPGGRRTAALVLAVVAALVAAWFGWSWYGAAHDESLRYSQTRDEVLRAGEQAVQNLNTLDYRNLNQGLKLWQDSTTSELYREIVQGRAGFERALREGKTITSAKVLEAAVTELDVHAGKASVIVGIQITVTPPKGNPAIKKPRLMGELTRTSTGWKLSALAMAPVGATG
jgi:Mce-associated membrane protein